MTTPTTAAPTTASPTTTAPAPGLPEPADGGPTLRVGVDIGGSKIAVLVVDSADRVRARRHVPAASSEPEVAIAQIAAVIRDAVDEAGATMADVAAV